MNSWQKPTKGRHFVLVDNECTKSVDDVTRMFPVKAEFSQHFSRTDLRINIFFISFAEVRTVKELTLLWPRFSINVAPDNVPNNIGNYLAISNLPKALRDDKIAEELVSLFTDDFNVIEAFPSLVTVNIPNVKDAIRVFRFLSVLKIDNEITSISMRNEDIPLVRVTNLPKNVNEKLLVELFSRAGNITHVDIFKQGGYRRYYVADVSFERVENARYAIKTLNYTIVNEKEIRVSQYISRETVREVELNSLVISGLPQYFSSPMLKVLLDSYVPAYQSYMDEIGPHHIRYGIVKYTTEDQADHCIAILNNAAIDGCQIKINRSKRVAICNFAIDTKDEDVLAMAPSSFDLLNLSARDKQRRPTMYLQFLNEQEMNEGIQKFNSIISNGVRLYAFELKKKRNINSMRSHFVDEQNQHCTVAIHNINPTATNEEEFVRSCLRYGNIEGYHFAPPVLRVVFSKPEDAQRFVKENRRSWVVGGDKLSVALSV